MTSSFKREVGRRNLCGIFKDSNLRLWVRLVCFFLVEVILEHWDECLFVGDWSADVAECSEAIGNAFEKEGARSDFLGGHRLCLPRQILVR